MKGKIILLCSLWSLRAQFLIPTLPSMNVYGRDKKLPTQGVLTAVDERLSFRLQMKLWKWFHLNQTEDYSLKDSLSDYSEELLRRNVVFSSFISCHNKGHQRSQADIPSRFQKLDRHVHSGSVVVSVSEKRAFSSKGDQHWHPRKRGVSSLTWTFVTSGQWALFFYC